jgi:alginate O-acetyltransferase complex protein AlgI
MWLALWIGFKVLTLLSVRPGRLRDGSPLRILAYTFLWHGTDPAPFLERPRRVDVSPRILLFNGARNMCCGALVLWMLSWATWLRDAPLAQAWIGLVGLGLLLHLGVVDWVTAFWQWRGTAVERLFRFPLGATSVADFWGGRWNLAFTHLTHRAIFRPLVRRFGSTWGTMAGFLFSGALHELVVSFPAGAGYGLPTLYFTLQGVCVALERRWLRRTVGLRNKATAWLWTCAAVLGPLPMMFHPPFLREIVLPLLRWCGAAP